MQWLGHGVIGWVALAALLSAAPVSADWRDWLDKAQGLAGGIAGEAPSGQWGGDLKQKLSKKQITKTLKTTLTNNTNINIHSLTTTNEF